MPAPVISVENLSKRYLIGHRAERTLADHFPNFRDMVEREIRNAVRKAADVVHGRQVVQGDAVEEFWALRDVGFEVHEGEVLGIIGRNGAGKSTLLKILSRITEPTAGRVTLRGRVASLLEVGTGFHPELTGRENVYLNGAILGMSRAEIRKKFDEIVAFAEVEKFLDTPVKRYSSGMYVRLAFAVAAHLEPEILIVDEVLAVGDAEFQKKCLGRMSEVARGGRTVLFVSHNMSAVLRLCSRAMALDRGAVLMISDDVPKTVETYAALSRGNLAAEWINSGADYINEDFVPISLRVHPVSRPDRGVTSSQSGFLVEIIGDVLRADPALLIAFSAYTSNGLLLFTSSLHDSETSVRQPLPPGRTTFRARLPSALLNEGDYEIELIAVLHNRSYLIPQNAGPRVRFTNSRRYLSAYWDRPRNGILAPELAWEVESDIDAKPRWLSNALT